MENTRDVFLEISNQEECYKFYEKHATEYEEIAGESGPYKVIAQAVLNYFAENARTSDARAVKILDVAAGTGMVGEELNKLGFYDIDALDASPSMLKIAKKKRVYNTMYCDVISERPTSIAQDQYDCVVIGGAFSGGHIPCLGLLEIIRMVKPGGLVVNEFGERYLEHVPEYRGRLEPFMRELEERGYWQQLEKRVCPDYTEDYSGLLYIHRVTASGVDDFATSDALMRQIAP